MRDDVVLALVGASASDRYCSRLFFGRQLWCADDLCYQFEETAVGRIARFVQACRAITAIAKAQSPQFCDTRPLRTTQCRGGMEYSAIAYRPVRGLYQGTNMKMPL